MKYQQGDPAHLSILTSSSNNDIVTILPMTRTLARDLFSTFGFLEYEMHRKTAF